MIGNFAFYMKHLSDEHKKKISMSCLGRKVWNKGKTGLTSSWLKGKKMPTWIKNKISATKKITAPKGENCHQWKGNDVGYRALHMWVDKYLGKPRYCEECKISTYKQRYYHWANISGNYQRIKTDWRRLCAKCHGAFDKANGMRKRRA